MGAAEKIVLWDSWLRGESPKATWRAFGKPSSLFIASWPPVLRRPVATTDQSGQKWILAQDGLSAYDPSATLAVHCGNGFDAGFSPYQSTRLIR
jgi:hypothetical protein